LFCLPELVLDSQGLSAGQPPFAAASSVLRTGDFFAGGVDADSVAV